MKKIIIGIVAVVLIIVGISYFRKNSNQPISKEPIKIGVILPLTRNNASYGEKFLKGLNLANDEINANGGIGGEKSN